MAGREIDINIRTKYADAVKGANQTSESYKKLGNQLAEAAAAGKNLDDITIKYKQSLSNALIDIDATKEGVAALTAQKKLLSSELAKVGLRVGENNKLYKEMSSALDGVEKELQSMPAAQRKVNQGFKDMEKSSGGSATKLLSVAKNILKFQLLMGPITSAIRGFKNTLSDSVKVAAEAEQVFSKLETVFSGVEKAATGMAKALASSLGVANSTAAGALSTVGDLLQAQGMGTADSLTLSSDWVKQFQDIIAFKDINMSLEEFAQNFMSGAAGNLRNFRTFGSIVKESAVNARLAAEGYDQLTGSELELAKMVTRATMALEQQANAMGATEREWETMLSVNRRLSEASKAWKENMGSTLNTVLKPMKGWLADILTLSNRIASATEEIRTGEFTIKTQQVSDSDASQMFAALIGKNNLSNMNFGEWYQYLNAGGSPIANLVLGIRELISGQNPYKEIAAKEMMNRVGYSANDIADIMKATGISKAQVKSIAEESGYDISDDIINQADILVSTWKTEQAAILDVVTSLEKLGSETDTFTESLASLAYMDFTSSNAEKLFASWDVDFENKEGLANYAGTLAGTAVERAIRLATTQIAGFSPDTYIDNIDTAFGTGDKAAAYQSWLNEIKDLYTILYNRQKKFGDVSDETLNGVIALWGRVNDELAEYQKGVEAQAAYGAGISSLQGSTLSYQRQLDLIGLSEFDAQVKQLTYSFEDMKAQFAGFTDEQLAELGIDLKVLDNEFNLQIEAYRKLYEAQMAYERQLTAQSTGRSLITGYQDSIEKAVFVQNKKGANVNFALNGKSNTFYGLNSEQAGIWYEYSKAINDMSATLKDVPFTYNEAGQKIYDFGEEVKLTAEQVSDTLYDYFIPRIKEAADVVKSNADAWKALGNRALGSTGTMGGVIQALASDEGDTWTKILNAILTILENTEGWEKVSEMLDQVFAAFMPVVEAIIDLLESLPWDIIIFCVKVIASVIVIIAKFFEQIFNVFDWLWTNIKAGIHNIVEAIKHPLNKNARDTWDGMSWKELQDTMEATAEKEADLLIKIWGCAWSIDSKMNENKDLKVLEDLWNRNIIDTQTYYKEAGSIQGYYQATPLKASEAAYVAQGPQYVSVTYGDVTLAISGGNLDEVEKVVYRVLSRSDVPYDVPLAAGGYY